MAGRGVVENGVMGQSLGLGVRIPVGKAATQTRGVRFGQVTFDYHTGTVLQGVIG